MADYLEIENNRNAAEALMEHIKLLRRAGVTFDSGTQISKIPKNAISRTEPMSNKVTVHFEY